jgi:hypothetical protein
MDAMDLEFRSGCIYGLADLSRPVALFNIVTVESNHSM